jgi:putative peptidoglycan lipid II flippase
MRLAFLLTVPATAGLMVLAEPIMSVIYQHGRTTAVEVAAAAGALRFYAVGLSGYAALKVLVNAFYALDQRRTPMYVSFCAVALNLALNWLFTFHLGWGVRGLSFSTGCVATFNFLVLYGLMRRHLATLETARLLTMLAKVGVATASLVVVCLASMHWVQGGWATDPFLPKLGRLLATVVVAMGAFAGCAYLLHIEELHRFVAAVRRRLG